MNLYLKHEEFKSDLVSVKREHNEVRYVFKFDNNYGASIVKNEYSYGHKQDLWELAVIWFDGDEWNLTYDTEITKDVIGYLTDEKVIEILHKIKNL